MTSSENIHTTPNFSNSLFPKFKNSRNNTDLNEPIKTIDILSKFGNSKLLSDTSLNKYYKKYIQKQAHIQHQQKLYELIENIGDQKIFNSLKTDYLREKSLLQNIHNNKKKENKRVIYVSNFINLNNCEEKLNSIYKLSTPDLNFMSSFMHFLGNRPKKIYRPKINKKLEALSQGKLSLFMKKKLSKQESNTNTNTNTLYNYNSYKRDNLIVKNPYLKYYLKDSNYNKSNSMNTFGNKKDNDIYSYNIHSNSNSNININNRMSKTNENFFKYYSNNNIRRRSINYENHKKGFTQRFLGKTKSTNFGMTNYNNFINNTNCKKRKSSYYYNNIKTENVGTNSDDNSIFEEKKTDKRDSNTNINFYNLQYSKTKSKFNSQTSLFSINNKSRSRSKNSTTKKISSRDNMINFNTKQSKNQSKKDNIIINQKYSSGINDEIDKKNIIRKDSDEITYDDISLLSNVKKKDKRTIQNRLIKLYKNTMNEFLQKIKDEEKDLNFTCSQLSNLLYKCKKYGKFENIFPKNLKKQKLDSQTNLNHTLQQKKSMASLNLKQTERNININKMGQTFYPGWGKSKFSIPYINKMVYGEENIMDTFEKLQKDLFYEVKNEIRKNNIMNKKKGKKTISINGKDILKKFKKNKDEMDESEIMELQ